MSSVEPKHFPSCFGCGQNNPIGLRLNFTIKDDCVVAEFTSDKYHIGPPDTVHGGVITAMIDESFSMLVVNLLKQDVRIIKEEISFRNPAKIGDKIYIEARLKEEKKRAFIATAKVRSDGNIIAEATGTLLKVKINYSKDLIQKTIDLK